jgi:site-specific DNA-methyltransferase (adenine-specific)
MQINQVLHGTCPETLKQIPDNFVDLTITSPPYDNLRKNYNSIWDFENTAKELYRITKKGGILIWVVGDATIKGSETLTSFKHALFFKNNCGFNMHDTMIYHKNNPMPLNHNRYEQTYEYMFVLAKGKPKTFNPIHIPLVSPQKEKIDHHHQNNYQRGNKKRGHNNKKIKGNIWSYNIGWNQSSSDKEAFSHPAIMPETLVADHIHSWSLPGELVFDPFSGSGTTAKMAALAGRAYLAIDCNEKYVELAKKRIENSLSKQKTQLP